MRGQVLGVDTRTGDGIVAGEDGRRYSFTPKDWAHRGEPDIGMYVDFETTENRALSLFPVPGMAPAPPPVASAPAATPGGNDRNKYIAALIAFLLGPLGVHRFYLGRTGTGITMLVLTCTIIGIIISGPWALIDMIRYLVMSDRDFAARYARTSD
jgi:TM2 domain-containing membrane protein YozV